MPLKGKPARGGDERAGDAREVIDLAGDQSGCLHGPGHLHHVDVQAMLFVDAGVFGDEER